MPRAGTKWHADTSGFHTLAEGMILLGNALKKGKREEEAKKALQVFFSKPGHRKMKAVLEGLDPQEALKLLITGKAARRQQRSLERREQTRQEGLIERERMRESAKAEPAPKAAELRAREDARMLAKQLQASGEGPRQALGRDIERMLNGEEDPDRILAGAAHLFGMGDFGGPTDSQTLKRVRDAAAIARQDRTKAVSAAPSSSETPAAALPSADAASSAAGAAPAANVPRGTGDERLAKWAALIAKSAHSPEEARTAITDPALAAIKPSGYTDEELAAALDQQYGGTPAAAPTEQAPTMLGSLRAGARAAAPAGRVRPRESRPVAPGVPARPSGAGPKKESFLKATARELGESAPSFAGMAAGGLAGSALGPGGALGGSLAGGLGMNISDALPSDPLGALRRIAIALASLPVGAISPEAEDQVFQAHPEDFPDYVPRVQPQPFGPAPLYPPFDFSPYRKVNPVATIPPPIYGR